MRRAWVLCAAAVVAWAWAAAACSGQVAGGAADGAAVFDEACAVCHGATGAPSPAMVTQMGVRDLTTPEFRARATVELVAGQVRKGSKAMPPFAGRLSDAQIDAVARYVVALPDPARR